MITIENNILTIQKPFNFDFDFYTLIFQNTVTKEIKQITLSDNGTNNMYVHFNVENLNLINGEYFLLLLSNDTKENINVVTTEIFNDNLKKSLIENDEVFYYLVYDNQYIINGDIYLGTTKNKNIKILTKELLKFGDYKPQIKNYNNTKKYISYNG